MICRIWRNYLLSGLTDSAIIVGCDRAGHGGLSENSI
jgi:hypothetical protein